MKSSDFDYHLPSGLIAQEPLEVRDRARMLVVYRSENRMEHRQVADLPDYLRAGDLLVANDTRVIPARLTGVKAGTGGSVEVLLLEEMEPGIWDVLIKASRRPKTGDVISIADGCLRAVMCEDGENGRARVRMESDGDISELIEQNGLTPLPPYIKRKGVAAECAEADRKNYQTVFARNPGAVAAPTAGLHFTPELLARIRERNVKRVEITLHVGLGTFRPVMVDHVEDHRMESERYNITQQVASEIQLARKEGGRIVAVGSTTVRVLETVALEHQGRIEPDSGRTSLFIYPGFDFHAVDFMFTNFHLPRSSLLMMVSAFAGRDLILKAYDEAAREGYRFYSYGDCMLIV